TRSRSLPEKPSAEHLRKQAKDLARGKAIQLAAAQRRLAREYGYRNWSELIGHVQSLSAAYKATREADEATGTSALEAGQALKLADHMGEGEFSLWKRRWRIRRSIFISVGGFFRPKVLTSCSSGAVYWTRSVMCPSFLSSMGSSD